MKMDVFISYSSINKPIADALCHSLESRNIKCWYAPRDILPGMDWTESIIEAIESSTIMVLIFSKDSNQSVQVKREVERAVHHNKVIIPFRIEDVPPTKSMEYLIGMHHWLDAFSLPEENAAIKKLVEAVEKNLGAKSQLEEVPSRMDGISSALTSSGSDSRLDNDGTPYLAEAPTMGTVVDSSPKRDDRHESKESRSSSAGSQKETAGRDKTKYILKGQKFGKGRLVHALVACYLLDNPDTTFERLKEVFPDSLQGGKYGVFAPLGEAEDVKTTTGQERYFLGRKDVLHTGEGKSIAVCSQWGIDNIRPMLRKAEELRYEITVMEP